ncbi:MAG: putative CRISPR-associated protein, partial [Chlorobiales bacterium]|nr:putative CRISPR-associated protein [Chlorobiales bacterium]
QLLLITYANCHEEESSDVILSLVNRLQLKALEQLESRSVSEIRKASAELNGLIGLNGGKIPSNQQDMHILVATDTVQGRATATTVKEYLQKCGCLAMVTIPKNLSTKDECHFSEGIKDLLIWCDEVIPKYKEDGYEIVFNLTGGFKSLQGYMNTIGMFYADRMAYIFESPESKLIEIPRLPIKLDNDLFRKHITDVLLLSAGQEYHAELFPEIAESLLDQIDGYVILSLWGTLVWNKIKHELLAENLIDLPGLIYEPSFLSDFKKINRDSNKVKLNEVLAKISMLVQKEQGSTRLLKADSGLQYENLKNRSFQNKPVGHFRVTQGLRVSCVSENGKLRLLHYGEHDYVNNHS